MLYAKEDIDGACNWIPLWMRMCVYVLFYTTSVTNDYVRYQQISFFKGRRHITPKTVYSLPRQRWWPSRHVLKAAKPSWYSFSSVHNVELGNLMKEEEEEEKEELIFTDWQLKVNWWSGVHNQWWKIMCIAYNKYVFTWSHRLYYIKESTTFPLCAWLKEIVFHFLCL